MVPWKSQDEMGVVVKALWFTALVLVLLGAWLLFTSRHPLMGALIMVAGAIDGLMAWGLTRQRS